MPPELTTQLNCEADIGIIGRHFLRCARRGAFPSWKEGRTIVARRADVLAYFEGRIQLAERTPSNDTDPEALALGRAGLRRVAQ